MKRQIDEQKTTFTVIGRKLLQAILNATLEDLRTHLGLYTKLMEHMERIHRLLKDVPVHLETILDKLKEPKTRSLRSRSQRRAEANSPDQEFSDVLAHVKTGIDAFSVCAKPLIGKKGPADREDMLQRFETEAVMASTLFQCLSRVCPDESHRDHTIYIALSADDAARYGTRLAIQSRVRSNNRVWLRVHSSSNRQPNLDESVQNASSTKRKLIPDPAVTPTRPPSKRRRFLVGRLVDHDKKDASIMVTSSTGFSTCQEVDPLIRLPT
ncbi:hypothetical protein GGR57DRAFT_479501 [Xylariaceae sp. FL1272]|nr:hypothetical protein GGR57DRAFT_479501 [Xylariaceae sp. FL1272]